MSNKMSKFDTDGIVTALDVIYSNMDKIDSLNSELNELDNILTNFSNGAIPVYLNEIKSINNNLIYFKKFVYLLLDKNSTKYLNKIDSTIDRISEFPIKDFNNILLKLNNTIDKITVRTDKMETI